MPVERDEYWDFWDNEFRVFPRIRRVPYVANPPTRHNSRRPELTTPVKPTETYDWATIQARTYIDKAECHGYSKGHLNTENPPLFRGYQMKPLDEDLAKNREGFRSGRSYYGREGNFHLMWARQWSGDYEPYTLRVVMKPKASTPLWSSLDWMASVYKEVGRRYSRNGLRMTDCELATDFDGDFDLGGLAQCYWRGWSGVRRKADGFANPLAYDGTRRSSGVTVAYEKAGKFHAEDRSKRKRLKHWRAVCPSTAFGLLLLLIKYRNTRFLCIDWNRIRASRACADRFPHCWDYFKSHGIVAALRQMRERGVRNPEKKAFVHPIDAAYRKALAAAIADGVRRLAKEGRAPPGLTPTMVRRRLADRRFLREFTEQVARLVRAEYRRLPRLRPRYQIARPTQPAAATDARGG
jgi:hypothetical protein